MTTTLKTAADLFAGLGGSTEGARQAGVEVKYAINHNPVAVQHHATNHPDTVHYEQDLMEYNFTSVPCLVDLLMASPACQGRSTAGQPANKGTGGSHPPDPIKMGEKHQHDRNTAWAVISAAETLEPRFLMVENVPAFQTWKLFHLWINALEEIGYAAAVHTLNGLDYGGAQDRRRTIITAHLGGAAIELVPSLNLAPRTIGDCLDPDDHEDNRWTYIADAPERMKPLMKKAQNQAGRQCFWNNVTSSRGRPLDDHFPTATTSAGSQWNLLDGKRRRVLNSRELARSMSFPENYVLPSKRGPASRLVGNAIDVRLAAGVVKQMQEAA